MENSNSPHTNYIPRRGISSSDSILSHTPVLHTHLFWSSRTVISLLATARVCFALSAHIFYAARRARSPQCVQASRDYTRTCAECAKTGASRVRIARAHAAVAVVLQAARAQARTAECRRFVPVRVSCHSVVQ